MNFWNDYFEPKYFFIAFFIGVLLVYITSPTPEVILRYPTPNNAGHIVYKDHADMCYVYHAKQVPCHKNAIETPLQLVNNKKKNDKGLFTTLFHSSETST